MIVYWVSSFIPQRMNECLVIPQASQARCVNFVKFYTYNLSNLCMRVNSDHCMEEYTALSYFATALLL